MKRNLHLFILMFFTSFGLFGQLGISTDQVLEATGTTSDSSVKIDVTIESGTENVGEFYWEIIRSESMSEDWLFSVCDINTCYAPGIEVCPESKSNELESGQSIVYNFYLNPRSVAGTDVLRLRLYSKEDPTVTFAEAEMTYIIGAATSTQDGKVDETISLYPNPASDYFSIEHDQSVSSVAVFSIVGKEMFSYKHERGQAYSVTDLNKGFYMARLIGDDGQTLKIIRFSKK